MNGEILALPDEPSVGAIIELLDGAHQGDRYRRDPKGWILLAPHIPPDDVHRWSWSEIWWAVTEDGAGGTQVRVTIPDPDDPHPLPWRVAGNNVIWDSNGDRVPLEFVVAIAAVAQSRRVVNVVDDPFDDVTAHPGHCLPRRGIR